MEKKERNCECNCWCGCGSSTWLRTLILVICTLIWGACLWFCMNQKIGQMEKSLNQIHKLVIEMSYGSDENFEKIYNAVMTEKYIKSINEQVEQQVASLTEEAEATEDEADATTGEPVNPSAEEWNGTADEAYQLFGLSGTPGNAIINTKTRMYKAVGGAYPKESFDEAIAAVRDGSAKTDDMGNAWTLTETQLTKLLDGVFFKNDNKDAEIVIIEYSDLICPFCQRHYDSKTLESIVEEDANVALVFKNMPLDFHPTADLGAKWVECAGEVAGTDAYYNFLDKAFATAEADGKFTNESLESIAKELKIDASKFSSCLNA